MRSGVICLRTAVRGASCELAFSWHVAQLVKYWLTPVLSDRPCASADSIPTTTVRSTTAAKIPAFLIESSSLRREEQLCKPVQALAPRLELVRSARRFVIHVTDARLFELLVNRAPGRRRCLRREWPGGQQDNAQRKYRLRHGVLFPLKAARAPIIKRLSIGRSAFFAYALAPVPYGGHMRIDRRAFARSVTAAAGAVLP